MSDCLLFCNFESIDRDYRGTAVLNQLSKLIKKIIRNQKKKNEMDFFEASEKVIHFFHLYEQNKILCLLRTQGALALPLESDKDGNDRVP